MKKIKLLLMCVSTLLMSANLKAAPSTFEEMFQFGQNTTNCGNGFVNAAFSLSENYISTDCEIREFKITYFQDNVYLKCGGYKFMEFIFYK